MQPAQARSGQAGSFPELQAQVVWMTAANGGLIATEGLFWNSVGRRKMKKVQRRSKKASQAYP
jgi:hypothetical protein